MRNYGTTRGEYRNCIVPRGFVLYPQLARWALKQTTTAIQATTRWHEVFGPKRRQKHGARGQNKPQSSGSTGSTQRSQEDASSQPSSVSEGLCR